jgi:hypothetical protein
MNNQEVDSKPTMTNTPELFGPWPLFIMGADEQAKVYNGHDMKRVVFEPGNCTKYDVLLVMIPKYMGVYGCDNSVLVVNELGGATHSGYFYLKVMLTADYVAEKMNYKSITDASEITKIIGSVFRRSIRVFTNRAGSYNSGEYTDIMVEQEDGP